jgi:hypothetical protein
MTDSDSIEYIETQKDATIVHILKNYQNEFIVKSKLLKCHELLQG